MVRWLHWQKCLPAWQMHSEQRRLVRSQPAKLRFLRRPITKWVHSKVLFFPNWYNGLFSNLNWTRKNNTHQSGLHVCLHQITELAASHHVDSLIRRSPLSTCLSLLPFIFTPSVFGPSTHHSHLWTAPRSCWCRPSPCQLWSHNYAYVRCRNSRSPTQGHLSNMWRMKTKRLVRAAKITCMGRQVKRHTLLLRSFLPSFSMAS